MYLEYVQVADTRRELAYMNAMSSHTMPLLLFIACRSTEIYLM